MGEMRSAYNNLVRKPVGKRPLGYRDADGGVKIRMDLREIRWEVLDWKHLA
jgi:hypothetical protein